MCKNVSLKTDSEWILLMKTFIVNLEKDIAKKEKILEQTEKLNLKAEIIPAVYGKNLSKEDLKNLVYDYPNCALTLGEIGCALSHLNIYNKMVKDDIPIAFILEDDVILSKDIVPMLDFLEKSNDKNKPNVYLMSYMIDYLPFTKKKTPVGNMYKIYRSYCTCAYVINKEAAKKLSKMQTPIKFEADMWESFRFISGINVYGIIPHLVYEEDVRKEFSSIENERLTLKRKRKNFRAKLILKYGPRIAIKKFFYRTIVKLLFRKRNKKK